MAYYDGLSRRRPGFDSLRGRLIYKKKIRKINLNRYQKMLVADILWIIALVGFSILFQDMKFYIRMMFVVAIIITIAAAYEAYKGMREETKEDVAT